MAGLKVFDGSIWKSVGVEDSYWNILSITENGSTIDLSWPTAGGSPSSYEIAVDNSVINVGNVNSYKVSGLTIGNSYNFKVRPVYADGSVGGWSFFKNGEPTGFNEATGGSILDVENYNGSGETWRIHEFSSDDTFDIVYSSASNPFKALVVAGGGGGGDQGDRSGGGGGGGGYLEETSLILSSGSYSLTVGSGGAINSNGGNSVGFGLTAIGGGRGNGGSGGSGGGARHNGGIGTGTSGQGNNGGSGFDGGPPGPWIAGGGGGAGAAGGRPTGGAGKSSSITGTSLTYAGGGGGGAQNSGGGGNGSTTSGYGQGGRGWGASSGASSTGTSGVIIVSYRIA